MKLHRFPKSERLRSKKLIDTLFNPAQSAKLGGNVFLYPFKIIWIDKIDNEQVTPNAPIPPFIYPQVLFSVSKRNFKRATDRNRIRRQLKEVYRLHKSLIFEKNSPPAVLGIAYVAKDKAAFAFIEKKMLLALKKMRDSRQK
ncbi:MAG: ribonuclease P protein component [Cytophagales bacterium]|nr:MAG: ribonuclease P protein component [Cytophagales bacterium]